MQSSQALAGTFLASIEPTYEVDSNKFGKLTIAAHSECGQFIFTHCTVSLTLQTLRDHQHAWRNLFESTSYCQVIILGWDLYTGDSVFFETGRLVVSLFFVSIK